MSYAAFYLRRSSADDDDPGDVSQAAQLAACQELAKRDNWTGEVRTFIDWNKSADQAKEVKRTAWAELLSEIKRGEVVAVYAASLDRLYRSMSGMLKLSEAAKARPGNAITPPRQAVKIATLRDGTLGGDGSPMAVAFGQISATFTEMELNVAKARARSAIKAREARGDAFGHAPYGYRHERHDGHIVTVPDPSRSLEPVMSAWGRSRSILGTVRLLNIAHVPSPKGKTWCTTTLRRVLTGAGAALPQRGPTGRRIPAGASILSQIVVCHCGHVMTPNAQRRQLYCSRGMRNPAGHGRYNVSESSLLPYVHEELAHFAPPDGHTTSETHEAERTALQERRRRLAVVFADGLMDDGTYRAELTKIRQALDDLDDAARIVDVPSIDWTAPVAMANEALRALLTRIELDANMRPVAAIWRVPRMRRA